MADKSTQQKTLEEQRPAQTKLVRNKSGQKIELDVNGKVVVFLPGVATEVPADFNVPGGIGLYVR